MGPVIGTTEVVPFQSYGREGLKPQEILEAAIGTAEAVPFQSGDKPGLRSGKSQLVSSGASKAAPFQSNDINEVQELAHKHATQK